MSQLFHWVKNAWVQKSPAPLRATWPCFRPKGPVVTGLPRERFWGSHPGRCQGILKRSTSQLTTKLKIWQFDFNYYCLGASINPSIYHSSSKSWVYSRIFVRFSWLFCWRSSGDSHGKKQHIFLFFSPKNLVLAILCLQALVGEAALIPILASATGKHVFEYKNTKTTEDPNTTSKHFGIGKHLSPHHTTFWIHVFCHMIFWKNFVQCLLGPLRVDGLLLGRWRVDVVEVRLRLSDWIGRAEQIIGEYAKGHDIASKKALQYLQGIGIVFTNKVSQKNEVEQ